MNSDPDQPSRSTTFNGNYNDAQGNQDFRHTRNFGTINSTFTTISGDQNDQRSYVNHGPIFYMHPGTGGSRGPWQNAIDDFASVLGFTPASNGPYTQVQSFQQKALMVADDASALMISIILLLANRTVSSNAYGDLKQSLRLLNQTILATSLALKVFEFTPLGRNLAIMIKPIIVGCCGNLKELFDTLDDSREGVSFTFIRSLWSLWSGPGEAEGLSMVKAKLSVHQIALQEFLVALNSCVWYTLDV